MSSARNGDFDRVATSIRPTFPEKNDGAFRSCRIPNRFESEEQADRLADADLASLSNRELFQQLAKAWLLAALTDDARELRWAFKRAGAVKKELRRRAR